jgi:gamma-glutamyltranspeptidase/glutathione hydrolase
MDRMAATSTRTYRAHRGMAALLALCLSTSACSTLSSVNNTLFGRPDEIGTPGIVRGFLGGVVADEPRAALVARQILSGGGNAADAAVALGFALSVTLPSRAGLGGGGACLAFRAGKEGTGRPDAVMFVPQAPASAAGADRPAAVPMLARGLFALHARYGRQNFETLIGPAETMARFGVPASRAFVRDLAVVAGPLGADPGAYEAFFANGKPLAEGGRLLQPELGGTLSQIRLAGVGDLYQGALGRRITDGAGTTGSGLTLADLRGAVPSITAPLTLPARGGDTISFLPPPADGGLATAAAYQVLEDNPAALDAARARALAAAARWRQGGATTAAILAGEVGGSALPALPASTSFATLDKDGNAVVCAVTMNNLFGTGRIAPGTGVLLAASPSSVPAPLLAAAMATNTNFKAFHAAVGGSGQDGAPVAAALGIALAVPERRATAAPNPGATPEPGRANIIACSRYLPDSEGSCGWATDPRGAGIAVGSN